MQVQVNGWLALLHERIDDLVGLVASRGRNVEWRLVLIMVRGR